MCQCHAQVTTLYLRSFLSSVSSVIVAAKNFLVVPAYLGPLINLETAYADSPS